MKKFYFVLALLFSVSFTTYSQKLPMEGNKEGKIVLKNNEIYYGEIAYNMEMNIVQCKVGGAVKAFGAYKVKFFEFYDINRELLRRFKVMNLPYKRGNSGDSFYEVLLTGELNLLRKEFYFFKSMVSPLESLEGISGGKGDFQRNTSYKYYVYSKGNFLPIKNFKKEILPLMSGRERQIKEYIRENRLSYRITSDQVMIISYFNKLTDPTKRTVARNQ